MEVLFLRFAEEGHETRAGFRIGDDGLPTLVLLAGKQETGEVRHFLLFVLREGFTKIGDFSGAHDNWIMEIFQKIKRLSPVPGGDHLRFRRRANWKHPADEHEKK